MPLITLTTDWNNDDFYAGAVKGKLANLIPGVQVVDITHNIKPNKIPNAAFIIRNTFNNFPKGTVHIIGVQSQIKDGNYLIVKYNQHFFIGADNGIFGLIFKEQPQSVHIINTTKPESTFPELDIFCETAGRLLKSESMENLGTPTDKFHTSTPIRAVYDENVITGKILHIDSYKNAITNISRELFKKLQQKRKYTIYVQSNYHRISRISNFYDDVPPGELVAIFNSLDLMEIAINNGNATELLNLDNQSTIRIKFE